MSGTKHAKALIMTLQKQSSPLTFVLFLTICLHYGASPSMAQSGRSGDGGGSGVACFEDAKTAEKAMNSNGRINREYISRIQSLDMTEVWPYKVPTHDFIVPTESETSDQFLERILQKYVMPLSPTFGHSLKNAIEFVNFPSWKNQQGLNRLEDLGADVFLTETLEKFPQCKIVQIISRHQDFSVQPPKVSVTYDQELFEKLGINSRLMAPTFQKAVAKLHESVYLIGYGLNQNSSFETRVITRFLIRSKFYDFLNHRFRFSKPEAFFRKLLLGLGLDQHTILWNEKYTDQNKVPSRKRLLYKEYKNLSEKLKSFYQKESQKYCDVYPKSLGLLCEPSEKIIDAISGLEEFKFVPELFQMNDGAVFLFLVSNHIIGHLEHVNGNTIDQLLDPDFSDDDLLKYLCRGYAGYANLPPIDGMVTSFDFIFRKAASFCWDSGFKY
jgi:hypothetical protein